jgi:hypothetical protein
VVRENFRVPLPTTDNAKKLLVVDNQRDKTCDKTKMEKNIPQLYYAAGECLFVIKINF